MRMILVAAAVALGVHAAGAGELCNTLDMQGNYDAGDACRLDETEAQMARERERAAREVDESLRRQREDDRDFEDQMRRLRDLDRR